MELTDRKKKILNAIIRNYLETGEPVGSRTISKYTDLNLSSVTIRNEMADLEEMELILQPHTSAGRVPSDKGYRVYVDEMLREKEQEVNEMKEMLIEKEEKLENLLKQVAKQLAISTNYASMITTPKVYHNKVKFLQLSRIGEDQLLITVVIEGNVIKNRVMEISNPIDDATVLKLNMLLNTHLNGLSVEDISLGLITALKNEAGDQSEVVSQVIDAAAESIHGDEGLEIYTSGANNIFRYPELSDNDKASELISFFEEKNDLKSIAEGALETAMEEGEENAIRVYIGSESRIQSMENCSVVTATYDLGDGLRGTVGIIGPKRMDYDKVVRTMKSLMQQLDDIYDRS